MIESKCLFFQVFKEKQEYFHKLLTSNSLNAGVPMKMAR